MVTLPFLEHVYLSPLEVLNRSRKVVFTKAVASHKKQNNNRCTKRPTSVGSPENRWMTSSSCSTFRSFKSYIYMQCWCWWKKTLWSGELKLRRSDGFEECSNAYSSSFASFSEWEKKTKKTKSNNHHQKQWEIPIFNRKYIFKTSIFHCQPC